MIFALIPAIISAIFYFIGFITVSAALGILSGIIAVIMGEAWWYSLGIIGLTLLLRYIIFAEFTNFYGFGYAFTTSVILSCIVFIVFYSVYFTILKRIK